MTLSQRRLTEVRTATGSTSASPTDVIVVGGGASGVLMAFHLLRDADSDVRVTLIERGPKIGRGVAYGTTNPDHLLNARAVQMSAVHEEPDHFWSWLGANAELNPPLRQPVNDPSCFAPRTIYGDYVANLIEPYLGSAQRPGRLRIVRGECHSVQESRSGVAVTLADGSRHLADFAVLATGHDVHSKRGGCYVDPWQAPAEAGVDRNARVLVIGTGLTMVDYVLSLQAAGHDGPIIAMSRRGLLPRPDYQHPALTIPKADIPIGAGAADLLRWLQRAVKTHAAEGGDWRSVMDAIRPFNQEIWQGLSESARRSFLRHGRAWWSVHRHRMAPEIHARISATIGLGRLTVMAARICAVEADGTGATVRYRRRGASAVGTLRVDNIVECCGVVTNPAHAPNPVVRNLLDSGAARVDALGIGLDVAPNGAIIARSGVPSERLFAIGPAARAAFWEITAIAEIRSQCAELAGRMQRTRLRRAG